MNVKNNEKNEFISRISEITHKPITTKVDVLFVKPYYNIED